MSSSCESVAASVSGLGESRLRRDRGSDFRRGREYVFLTGRRLLGAGSSKAAELAYQSTSGEGLVVVGEATGDGVADRAVSCDDDEAGLAGGGTSGWAAELAL